MLSSQAACSALRPPAPSGAALCRAGGLTLRQGTSTGTLAERPLFAGTTPVACSFSLCFSGAEHVSVSWVCPGVPRWHVRALNTGMCVHIHICHLCTRVCA